MPTCTRCILNAAVSGHFYDVRFMGGCGHGGYHTVTTSPGPRSASGAGSFYRYRIHRSEQRTVVTNPLRDRTCTQRPAAVSRDSAVVRLTPR